MNFCFKFTTWKNLTIKSKKLIFMAKVMYLMKVFILPFNFSVLLSAILSMLKGPFLNADSGFHGP